MSSPDTAEWSFYRMDNLFINDLTAGPVTIDCSTGEVTIEEGINMNAASIKFWRTLERSYPYLFGGGGK